MFKHSISLTGAVLFLLSAGLVQGQVTPKPDDAARHGFLGVGVAPARDTERGVVVRDLVLGSPAAKAGLKPGDMIVKMNDQDVKNPMAFSRAVFEKMSGDKLTLHVMRDGKDQTMTVTLGERPQRESAVPAQDHGAFLGVRCVPLNPELRRQLNVKADAGVVVMDVMPHSPADKAGLKAQDVITAVNGTNVKDPESLRDAIHKAGDKEMTLTVLRGDKPMTLKATPAKQ